MQKILIYKDKGVSRESLQSLIWALEQENPQSIDFIDHVQLKKDNWQKETSLLIFPGGRDLPYQLALQGRANQQIKNYVWQGGKYFGICAGGYYGSASIEFAKGTPLEIIAPRELGFFRGIASGPALGAEEFSYQNSKGSRIARLLLSETTTFSYFNGGAAFIGDFANVQVIARYQDVANTPPAIIQCTTGKGKAILSGVHPEYSAYHIATEDAYLNALLPELKKIESHRKALFQHLLGLLLS